MKVKENVMKMYYFRGFVLTVFSRPLSSFKYLFEHGPKLLD